MRTTIGTILGVAGLAFALGCGPDNRQAANDADLSETVSEQLRRDPALQTQNVTARADDGHVTLSGTVATADARERAERAARTVEGVKGVTNQLQVRAEGGNPAVSSPPGGATPGATPRANDTDEGGRPPASPPPGGTMPQGAPGNPGGTGPGGPAAGDTGTGQP